MKTALSIQGRDRPEPGKSANDNIDARVTTVIHHRPPADAIGRYEDWLKEIASAGRQF